LSRCGDWRVNDSCLPRDSPKSAGHQAVAAGKDSNYWEKSRRIIVVFAIRKSGHSPFPDGDSPAATSFRKPRYALFPISGFPGGRWMSRLKIIQIHH
jgi:hypothetical protein